MDIRIDWMYFLGIMGGIIVLAFHASGRFARLEESLKWVRDSIGELKIQTENLKTKAFSSHSPVNLTDVGRAWLSESGLREFVDSQKERMIKKCSEGGIQNPYELQLAAFKLFDEIEFPPELDDRLKKFAYERGTSLATVRRVGGIYFRDQWLQSLGVDREEIDVHDPSKKNEA